MRACLCMCMCIYVRSAFVRMLCTCMCLHEYANVCVCLSLSCCTCPGRVCAFVCVWFTLSRVLHVNAYTFVCACVKLECFRMPVCIPEWNGMELSTSHKQLLFEINRKLHTSPTTKNIRSHNSRHTPTQTLIATIIDITNSSTTFPNECMHPLRYKTKTLPDALESDPHSNYSKILDLTLHMVFHLYTMIGGSNLDTRITETPLECYAYNPNPRLEKTLWKGHSTMGEISIHIKIPQTEDPEIIF